MDIFDCLKMIGPKGEEVIDADLISARVKAALDAGVPAKEAHRQAVDSQLNSLRSERAGIMKQINPPKRGGLSTGIKKAEARAAVQRAQSLQANKAKEQGPTVPESPETLQAGMDAIGRGGRIAAYSSDPNGFAKTDTKGMVLVKAKDGGVYAVPQADAHKVRKLDRAGKQSEILGYPNEKPDGESVVVQATDAQGRTVQDVATDEAGLATAKAQGAAAAGEGGSTRVTSADEALTDRAARDYDEDSDGLTIDPDDLIGALTDEAILQEPFEVEVRHNASARLLNKIYGSTSKTNKDGSRKVTIPAQDPKATQGDPNSTHPTVIKAMSKVFDDGRTEEPGRIQVRNPHGKVNEKTGKQTNTPANMPAIIRLGRALNVLNDTNTDLRTNLLTGLGHMYDLGFIPTKVRVKTKEGFKDRDLNITNGKETRLGLPVGALVYGRESIGTATTFGDVMGLNPGRLAKAKKNALKALDKMRAEYKALTSGDRYDKRTAALKHKKNVGVLRDGINELVQVLTDVHGVKNLKKTGQEDSREIDQVQEATVIRGAKKVVGTKKGPVSGDIVGLSSEVTEDTRGLETDAQQAAASAKNSVPRAKPSVKFPALRNNKVTQLSTGLNEKLVDYAGAVMKMLGIKTQVNIVDEDGAVELIRQYKEERATLPEADPRRGVLAFKIQRLEDMLTQAPRGRIEYNDTFQGDIEDRVPTIFVSMNNKGRPMQLRVLTHEIGHLLQRVAFDQAPKEVQDAIIRSMNGTKASSSNRFEENFANMLWRYLIKKEDSLSAYDAPSGATRKTQTSDLRPLNTFFKDLAKRLRQLWRTARDKYGVDEQYEQFVDAMVGTAAAMGNSKDPTTRLGRNYKKVIEDMTMGPFMAYRANADASSDNYSVDDIKQMGNRVLRDRRAALLANAAKAAGRTWNLAQDKVFRSSDAVLRAMESDAITDMADQFHHQPGKRKGRRGFFEEVRYWMGQRQVEMDEIMDALPVGKQKKGWWSRKTIDYNSGEYVQLMEMLRNGVTEAEFRKVGGTVGETGVKVRRFFDKQFTWLRAHGVSLDNRKNYFPSIADTHLWEANKDKVLAAFRKHNLPTEYAERVFKAVTDSDGYLADIYESDDKMLGPSFKFMKRRQLPPELLKDLEPYMVNDLSGIMTFYSKSAVERGVTQQRWGLSNDEKIKLEGEFDSLGIRAHMNSPVAKLHLTMSRALRDGEIDIDQFRVIKNKVLEAYFGRLGANIDPRWQKFQTGMIIYQNVRLLSLATLTAGVDAGQLVWRAGSARTAFNGLKGFFDKQTRADMYKIAQSIGAIDDAITAHVLNDQVTTQFMSARAKSMNETFFRFIGMHQWTNMTRVMGVMIGKEFLTEHAASGSEQSLKHLEELGVTPEQVDAWIAAGHPTQDIGLKDQHSEVISALNTFVDESIIRPDATTRPPWASDRNFQLLFHLKSFMWGYQEVILRRLWNQAKNQPNLQKSLIQGGMSSAMLVAATLPLAMAAYETRRWLSWWGSPPPQTNLDGLDYMMEVAQRAGYLGLFQFIADAEQAQDFGRLSLLSAMGPTLTQLEEFIRSDFAGSTSRAIPFLAQSGAGRAIYRDFVRN